VELHTRVKVPVDGKLLDTTVGRVVFNEVLPPGLDFVNRTLDKKALEGLVADCFRKLGQKVTAGLLDDLKEMGFEYATIAGITVGIDDILIPVEKKTIIAEAKAEVEGISSLYKKRAITEGERYNKVIDTWTRVTHEVETATFAGLAKDKDGFNPIFMMADSGSRGSREQIRQLAGMRGLMAKPQKKITGGLGEIIENPVIRNFKEGLTVLEYFISTHGARKGLADTALKTADAGYLTRRLVDVAQDVIITEVDCGSIMGLEVSALKEGEEIIEPLSDRILGRVSADDILDPLTGSMLVHGAQEIAEEEARRIEESGIERIRIRSVLTCETRRGVCAKCYGRNLATGRMVDMGEAVGVVAAQSIGEPGTQLTLRTFHIGGTASRIVEQSKIRAKCTGIVKLKAVHTVKRSDGSHVVVSHRGEAELYDSEDRLRHRFSPSYGAMLRVKDGQHVEDGQDLFEWDTYNIPILTERHGTVEFGDIKNKVTVRDEVDENTGMRLQVIVDDKSKVLQPHIKVVDSAGKIIAKYLVPTGSRLNVKDGQDVGAGEVLAKIRREISKTRDITGGLPRVSELFEARKPKDHASVSEIDGIVGFGAVSRGMRKLTVTNENTDEREYLIPHGRHLHVQDGDRVIAGDRLTEGPINPHDILRIKGIKEVQEYLVNEIQEVYRLQGVRIDDKHVEVIVRQMLQKVKIVEPGDTNFLEGELVDKLQLKEENGRVVSEGGQPATFDPLLLGITKASLSMESFISAASFQETTRVLTEASIFGSVDHLRGLKENVIIGYLIPAGTGLPLYRNLRLEEIEDERKADADAKTA
jgi:DNA-directed RNA polymerase subunit beta'